jgi:hypothetical protein
MNTVRWYLCDSNGAIEGHNRLENAREALDDLELVDRAT